MKSKSTGEFKCDGKEDIYLIFHNPSASTILTTLYATDTQYFWNYNIPNWY